MTPSIYDQVENVDKWLATTDRKFKAGDRVVHIAGGHNGRWQCPARGVLTDENPYWEGCFGLILDGKAEGDEFHPEMTQLVKEDEFDALGLVAISAQQKAPIAGGFDNPLTRVQPALLN